MRPAPIRTLTVSLPSVLSITVSGVASAVDADVSPLAKK